MRTWLIGWGFGVLMSTGVLYAYERVKTEEMLTRFAQTEPSQYCAKLRDGKMIVMHQGKELTGDVFLTNGATVKPDGTVITRDGVRTRLNDGDCIDINGNITRGKVE